jgi:hypothetical protein
MKDVGSGVFKDPLLALQYYPHNTPKYYATKAMPY